ncbi:MAG: arginine--tRNA ligase [Helicobacter sp.]|nr:arginine--tRNA ligase [Helicobacter sp.]
MHHTLKDYIARVLGQPRAQILLERPKEQSFGHYATPLAFLLAKEQRKNPKDIAIEIAKQLECGINDEIFAQILPIGGFVNFFLAPKLLATLAQNALASGSNFGKGQQQGKILLEFVSANPTGPLHIGHARGAVLGDCLARLARHLGYDVCTEYYVNDAGNQIALLGTSIWLAARSILHLDVAYPENYYRGEYINEIAQHALQQFGIDSFKIEADEAILANLATMGKDLMLDEIRENLASIGIVFDSFVSEKSLYARWESVRDTLMAKGGIYENEGKLWLASSTFGDEKDRVVVRDDGEPTYLAGDIIYHADKFQRGYDDYINIWGADHHGYIARVKAALQWLGFDSSRLEILLSQMVTLLKAGAPYKMSKRAGNFILLSDVVADVGSDVLRFVFLSKKSDTHLEFDVEDFKKQDSSNPVYYVHYAHARIHTLFARAQKSLDDVCDVSIASILADCGDLSKDCTDLAFLALQLPQIIEDAFASRNLVKMTDYLKNLAGTFHKFYNAHKILQQPNELELLALCALVAQTLRLGLSLLGISAPTHMQKED